VEADDLLAAVLAHGEALHRAGARHENGRERITLTEQILAARQRSRAVDDLLQQVDVGVADTEWQAQLMQAAAAAGALHAAQGECCSVHTANPVGKENGISMAQLRDGGE
jgi:hypothetical protein